MDHEDIVPYDGHQLKTVTITDQVSDGALGRWINQFRRAGGKAVLIKFPENFDQIPQEDQP